MRAHRVKVRRVWGNNHRIDVFVGRPRLHEGYFSAQTRTAGVLAC